MDNMELDLEKLVDKMPAFPSSVNQILELTADINSSPKDLIQVIEHDPVLTLKILKLVNSAYFGLSREVTSIKKSVVYIGLNSIKNVAISIAAIGVLPTQAIQGYSVGNYLIHSLNTATLSRLIAKYKGMPETELGDFFVTSLLHDIGQLALARFMTEKFVYAFQQAKEKKVPIQLAEKKFIGEDHAEVGAMLAEKWKLPENLIHCIRYHHRLHEFDDANILEKSIFLANQVSKIIEGEDKRISEIEKIPEFVQQWMGVALEDIPQLFPDLEEEIEKTRMFMKISKE